MDPLRKKWVIKTLRTNLGFILILVIVSVISVITSLILKISSNEIKILYCLGFVLSLIILLVLLYTKDFIKQLDVLKLDDCISQDVTILDYQKIIWFDSRSRELGAVVEETREIRNNMTLDYNRYRFRNSTDVPLPSFNEFEFYRDNIRMNYSEADLNFHCGPDMDYEDSLNNKFEFKFPIQAQPFETRNIRVKYRIKAFEPALNGEIDWVEIQINAITERLQIGVRLQGEISDNFFITEPVSPGTDGSKLDIEIRDFSGERMWNTEQKYKSQHIIPRYKKDTMNWIIYRPKIGCLYRVYFTIKPKNQ